MRGFELKFLMTSISSLERLHIFKNLCHICPGFPHKSSDSSTHADGGGVVVLMLLHAYNRPGSLPLMEKKPIPLRLIDSFRCSTLGTQTFSSFFSNNRMGITDSLASK